MDSARKIRVDGIGDEGAERLRSRQETGLDSLEKVLRFAMPGRETEADPDGARARSHGLSGRDIAHALELVHGAAQSLKAAEDRGRDSEARTQALVHRATEELKSAEARFQAAEARARSVEARLQEAEARAREAEEWLSQIFATIAEELPARR